MSPAQPVAGLTVLDAFNLGAAMTSIILAIVAIGLAIFFYVRDKDTETNVSTALAGIRSQTDALQKLTGRWMDRFTRYATEPKPADETLIGITKTPQGTQSGYFSDLEVLANAVARWDGVANVYVTFDSHSCKRSAEVGVTTAARAVNRRHRRAALTRATRGCAHRT